MKLLTHDKNWAVVCIGREEAILLADVIDNTDWDKWSENEEGTAQAMLVFFEAIANNDYTRILRVTKWKKAESEK